MKNVREIIQISADVSAVIYKCMVSKATEGDISRKEFK